MHYIDTGAMKAWCADGKYCAAAQCALSVKPDLELVDENPEFHSDNGDKILKALGLEHLPFNSEKMKAFRKIWEQNLSNVGRDVIKIQEACDELMVLL